VRAEIWTAVALVLAASGASAAAAPEGKVQVCVPVDFNWSSYASLELPANLVFEDSGYFSGSLTQSDKDYVERLNRTGSEAEDGKPLEGAFVLTEAVHLTKAAPCGQADARMLVMVPFQGTHGTAANHHVWLGWRVLGLSGWHDDFGKPGGLPLQLGQALDDFHVRAMLLSDLEDPVSIDPATQNGLLQSP
jgi:hypothetical protein